MHVDGTGITVSEVAAKGWGARSVVAENASLHEQNRRFAQHTHDLVDRLSELLGQRAFELTPR